MNTTLSVLLVTASVILGCWVLVGLLLVVLWRMAKVRVKRVEAYITNPTFSTKDINLVNSRGGVLTKDETSQVRDILRHRKEQEARDLNTIDTATEFHREV